MSNAPPSTHAARNSWLLLAVLAAGLFLVIWLRPLETVFRRSAASGKKVPSAALEPLVGAASPVNLAELRGNVVLVSLWGTWCPPCREELPHLAAIARQFADRDFRLITISCGVEPPEDLAELAGTTAEFLARNNLPIPAYADPGGRARMALAKAGVFRGSFPTTFVMDEQGVVQAVWQGYSPGTEREVEQTIASLLVQASGVAP